MKKLVFRGWVTAILIIIDILALFVLASDQENLGEFIIIHIIAMLVFGFTSLLLIKFGSRKYFE